MAKAKQMNNFQYISCWTMQQHNTLKYIITIVMTGDDSKNCTGEDILDRQSN